MNMIILVMIVSTCAKPSSSRFPQGQRLLQVVGSVQLLDAAAVASFPHYTHQCKIETLSGLNLLLAGISALAWTAVIVHLQESRASATPTRCIDHPPA